MLLLGVIGRESVVVFIAPWPVDNRGKVCANGIALSEITVSISPNTEKKNNDEEIIQPSLFALHILATSRGHRSHAVAPLPCYRPKGITRTIG
jgi:hypothetical protein